MSRIVQPVRQQICAISSNVALLTLFRLAQSLSEKRTL